LADGLLSLPIRGVLYTFSNDPHWLVGVQLLDGVGAGLYGALFPLIVADLMEGTGRFNIALGAVLMPFGRATPHSLQRAHPLPRTLSLSLWDLVPLFRLIFVMSRTFLSRLRLFMRLRTSKT
jgi:hypothetical protein